MRCAANGYAGCFYKRSGETGRTYAVDDRMHNKWLADDTAAGIWEVTRHTRLERIHRRRGTLDVEHWFADRSLSF